MFYSITAIIFSSNGLAFAPLTLIQVVMLVHFTLYSVNFGSIGDDCVLLTLVLQ